MKTLRKTVYQCRAFSCKRRLVVCEWVYDDGQVQSPIAWNKTCTCGRSSYDMLFQKEFPPSPGAALAERNGSTLHNQGVNHHA